MEIGAYLNNAGLEAGGFGLAWASIRRRRLMIDAEDNYVDLPEVDDPEFKKLVTSEYLLIVNLNLLLLILEIQVRLRICLTI